MSEEKISLSIQMPKSKFLELSSIALRRGILKSNLLRSWAYEKMAEDQKQQTA